LHRHIQCRPGQQPLQACPEGALQKLRLIEERYGWKPKCLGHIFNSYFKTGLKLFLLKWI